MNGIRTNSAGARGINWNEWESIGGLDVIVDEIRRRLSQATRIVASLGPLLPSEVQTDKVKSSMKDGVLEIRIPKTEEAKKKEVKVNIE